MCDMKRRESLLAGVIALVWTLLVWLNWFHANPVSPGKVWAAIAAYGTIRPGPALAAWAGHLRLIVVVVLLALAARGAGRPLAAWLRSGHGPRASLAALALGAGAIGLAVLGAGLAGLAFAPLALAAALAVAANGVRGWKVPRPARFFSARTAAFSAALLLGLWVTLTGNLAPEVSFDALGHHLLHPSIYLEHHKVIAVPWHFLSGNPALLEMQYLAAMLLGGTPQAGKLVHFAWGLLVLAVIIAWARETLEEHWALAAAAVFLFLPYVQLVMMWAYVDLGAAGCLALTLWAVRAPRKMALAGALGGLCAGVKITGVFAPVIAGALAIAGGARRREVLRAGAVFLAIAAPWGLKNWGFTGNPVAPLVPGIIPTLWWGAENYGRYNTELRSYAPTFDGGPVRALASLMAVPWGVSVHNAGTLDDGGGMGGWFLWGLPLLLLFGGGGGGTVPTLLFLGYLLLWLFIPRQARYLLPAWTVGAVACAHAARGLGRGGRLPAAVAWVAAAVLSLNAAGALQRQHFIINPLPSVFGKETSEQYLVRSLPGKPYSIHAQRWWHEHQRPGKLLLLSEYRTGVYWGPRAISQSVFDTPLFERFARETADASRLAVRMRQAGIRTGLYCAHSGYIVMSVYETFRFDPASARRWRDYWTTRSSCLYDQDDVYLYFSFDGHPAGAEPVPARGYLPGLDEQWLAGPEHELEEARAKGDAGRALARAEGKFAGLVREYGSPATYERLGIVLLQSGKNGPALEAFREAERRGRRSSALYDALGYLYWQGGEASEAIAAFRRSLKLKPDLEEARRNLASVLESIGRRDEALRELHEGLGINPASRPLREALARLTGSAAP